METNEILLSDLKSFLKGVNYLYHANTVTTSISFLQKEGLMSRFQMESWGFKQTPQESDDIDKFWGIYADIFFDSVDIHERTKRVKRFNAYGPVLFEFSLDVLDCLQDFEVKITKDNPINWISTFPANTYYYQDIQSLENEYSKGDFGKHLIVKNIGVLPFNQYLNRVIIDDPQREPNICLNAYTIINNLLFEKNLPSLEIRKCYNCSCHNYYSNISSFEFSQKFEVL